MSLQLAPLIFWRHSTRYTLFAKATDGHRHPFSFLLLLADRAGHPLNLDKLVPERFMEAMIASFEKDEGQLAAELKGLLK